MYCPLLSCNIYHKPRFFLYYLAVSSEGGGTASHCHHDSVYGVIGVWGFNLVVAEVSRCDIVDICMAIPDEM